MIIYNHHFLTLLKDCVLDKAEIKHLIPSECKHLSMLIYADTKKRISETTLKRIYGFAISKFKPSSFTLEALSEYCGYDGWENFCRQDSEEEKKTENKLTWDSLCKRANRITQFTLQALKKRAGIPYNLTIKRRFLQEHLDNFIQSNQAITIFTAPGGFGKTIGLCHLIDDLLTKNFDDTCDQNLILLFSANSITNISPNEFNLGEWFLSFFGLHQDKDLIELFEDRKTNYFFLIIDGFDEHMFNIDQFKIFSNQLLDILAYYSEYPWFKMIVTQRSSTWLNYRFMIMDKPLLAEQLHTGFMQGENQKTNILPFSVDEIIELSKNINPLLKCNSLSSSEGLQYLSNPLYFQIYYQLHLQNLPLQNIDQLSIYQLVSYYAMNKIYHGTNSMEKILLIKVLLELLNYQSEKRSVNKIAFYDYIKTYPDSYKELISNDIILEENFTTYLQYEELISFSDPFMLEYTLARKLYSWNDDKLDSNLIIKIESLLDGTASKVPVLKWIVFFIFSKQFYEQFLYLKAVSLNSSQQLEIIIFTCQMLQKQMNDTINREQLLASFRIIEQNDTFSFFLSLDYVTPAYEKALFTLLNFELTDHNKALVLTTLAIISIFNLNADKANEYICQLQQLPETTLDSFMVNPLKCLKTIYCYFKYGLIKKDALQDITHLYYNDLKIRKMVLNEQISEVVIFKLILFTLLINDNPLKELRLIRTVDKYLKIANIKKTNSNYLFFLSISSNAYLRAGKLKQALKAYNQVLQFQHVNNSMITPFMKVIFNILSVKSSAQNQANQVAVLQVKSLIAYSQKNGFKLATVFSGITFFKSSESKQTPIEDYMEIYNNVLKTLRVSGFRLESFISPALRSKIEDRLHKRSNVA